MDWGAKVVCVLQMTVLTQREPVGNKSETEYSVESIFPNDIYMWKF